MILGESNDSERNPGLNGRAKTPVSLTIHERFLGGGKNIALELNSGLIMDDSAS